MIKEPKNFVEFVKKYAVGTIVDEMVKDIRALLQRIKSEEERKLEETEKHGAFFSDYSNKEYEIYMYVYVMSRIDDLGRGIIVDIKSKGESEKSGSSGRHIGTGTDEWCEEK